MIIQIFGIQTNGSISQRVDGLKYAHECVVRPFATRNYQHYWSWFGFFPSRWHSLVMELNPLQRLSLEWLLV